MSPDRVSNPGLLTYESGALPNALRGPAPGQVVCQNQEPELLGLIPRPAHTFMETDHELFSMLIFPLPLILEGQLTVTGKSMGT